MTAPSTLSIICTVSSLITLQEAATILGCSRPMLYYWERAGKLAIVTGPYGRRLVARADILALRDQRAAPKA